ncbi:M23 family metallopeptidase [Saccharopolyspora hirsuta]|uniref:M23 family metallopeptidase n=1 Tax=Saccharopolyspora hirsuta TaxID=1837 RepID=A0A5M7BR14_SACHI|nr:M23 family metallopeptidase [Saccharopolyspora hirsuta]KAA5829631.1 M23 family metallopeptidase [Saccharopolyspora hirsuta]
MAIRERTALGGLAVLFAASIACAAADLSAAVAPPGAAAHFAAEFAAPRPAPAPAPDEEWVAPTDGEISSGFGERWGEVHRGVDVANDVGTPIRAASAGVVIDFGPASGYGLWIRIAHPDDVISTYGHIDAGFVSVGQSVRAGEVIATMGDRGQSTGPHLHFQIDVAGEPVDPVQFYAERSAELVG